MGGQITGITRQKKNRRRYNIFIDDEYAFSLSEKLAATLHIGDVIGKTEIADLKMADESELAFFNALHYLKFRPRSRYEVKCHLAKKGFAGPIVTGVLERLTEYGYLDDSAFARVWIAERNRNRPRGQFALQYELKSKGVPDKIVDTLLHDFDESGPAWRAVMSRLGLWSGLEEFELKKKIYDYLKRRGFSFATCEQVYRKAVANVKGRAEED